MNSWEAMDGIDKIEQFVLSEINRLRLKAYYTRAKRQLRDGERFIKMLHTVPYCEARCIGQLRKIIRYKRASLKDITSDISKLLPNYQLSLFDDEVDVSKERMEKLQIQKKIIEEEIHWLHKALGICYNKDYFK